MPLPDGLENLFFPRQTIVNFQLIFHARKGKERELNKTYKKSGIEKGLKKIAAVEIWNGE